MQYNANVSAITSALKVQPIPPITAFRVHQIKLELEPDCNMTAVGMQLERSQKSAKGGYTYAGQAPQSLYLHCCT